MKSVFITRKKKVNLGYDKMSISLGKLTFFREVLQIGPSKCDECVHVRKEAAFF